MSNNKESPFKAKIILGYLVPMIAGVFVVWYLFSQIMPLITAGEDRRDMLVDKIIMTGATVSSLYESELLGMASIQEPSTRNYKEYHASIEKVYRNIDSLMDITDQPLQQRVLQKLSELLRLKDQNMSAIFQQIQSERNDETLRKSLSSILSPTVDTIPYTIVTREKIISDTLPGLKKKNLWQRIANVFSPEEPDTTLRTNITRTFRKDTLHTAFSAYDTIPNTTVEEVLDSVHVEQMRKQRTMSKKLQALLVTDRTINEEINKLMTELQNEAIATAIMTLSSKRQAMQKTGYIVIVTAILAVVAIILFIIFIFNDLNKSKTYRKELEIARTKAEELMRSREKLLLTISHDIKAPLSSIEGYIELMQLSAPNADNSEHISSMAHSIRHVMELLKNLLEYSRLEANKTTLAPETFCLQSLFSDTFAFFYPLAKKKNIKLINNTALDSQLFVEMDKTRLRQVLTNLLSNALKFTDEGTIILAASVESRFEKKWLKFSVSDTGCGIPPDKAQFIFEEFAQISKADNQQKGGSGFGLFIVNKMVALFGGSISVAQNEPHGAVFTVQLPLHVVPAPVNVSIEVAEESERPVLRLTILALDDDPAQLALVDKILSRAGHTVVATNEVGKALALLNRHYFDLVVTDIQLKNETGFQLMEALQRSEDKRLQQMLVIAVSATDEFDYAYMLSKGFAGFIRKPFTIAQFQSEINSIARTFPLYDLNKLQTLMENDSDAVTQVLDLFVVSGKETLAQMKQYLERGNLPELKHLAHKIRPMFEQIDAQKIAALLSFIEHCDLTSENTPLFKEMVTALISRADYVLNTWADNQAPSGES